MNPTGPPSILVAEIVNDGAEIGPKRPAAALRQAEAR
jgi:hypothetical protein